ncbi:MAG: lipid A biosynthesis protein, partial [Deltaproteobacteria bacterium]|nr:lipid A biosynthesis protein [Deltaproteobacteria bacterium]
MKIDTIWLIIGFVGQAAFGMRFLVQWLYSEKYGRS